MQRIHKYPIPVADRSSIEMPAGAQILDVQIQRDVICLWALVDPDAPLEERHLLVAGTGQAFDDRAHHLGTVQHGALVLHVFETAPFPPHVPWRYGS